jgi:hypothetical protein
MKHILKHFLPGPCPRCRAEREYVPVLLGLSDRHAVRCGSCRSYGVHGDHRPIVFAEDRADLVPALAGRCEELDRCDALNDSVWAAMTASPEDSRWVSYRGHGLDAGGEP